MACSATRGASYVGGWTSVAGCTRLGRARCNNLPVGHETAADRCPGCGEPVKPGEDYVVAREHSLELDVSLHAQRRDRSDGVERRFHVGHFRGQLGNFFYELVAREHHPSQ
jgi:hypothetical protein